MNIGEMNRQVQWKMPIKNRNETGEQYTTWVTSNAVWAKVDFNPAGSDEQDKTDRDTSVTTVLFSMYYNAATRPTWRIVYKDDEYEIINIVTEGNKMFMDIEAKRYEVN